MKHILFWMAYVVALTGLPSVLACGPTPPTPATSTGSLPPDAGATCVDVCDHLRALGCQEAKSTQLGATCEQVCGNSATMLGWDLSCRAAVAKCADIEGCEHR